MVDVSEISGREILVDYNLTGTATGSGIDYNLENLNKKNPLEIIKQLELDVIELKNEVESLKEEPSKLTKLTQDFLSNSSEKVPSNTNSSSPESWICSLKKEFGLNSTIVVDMAYSEFSFLSRRVLLTPSHGELTGVSFDDFSTTFS